MNRSQLQQDLDQVAGLKSGHERQRMLSDEQREMFDAVHNMPVIKPDETADNSAQFYQVVLLSMIQNVTLPTQYASRKEAQKVADTYDFAIVEPVNGPEPEYIVLESIRYGHVFYTTYDPTTDQCKGDTGEVFYRVVGYARTESDAEFMVLI